MAQWRLDSSLTAERVEDIAVEIAVSADPTVEFVLHEIRRGGLSSTARLLGLLARLREEGRKVRLIIHTGDNAKGVRADSKYWEFFSGEMLGFILWTYSDSVVKHDGEEVRHLFESHLQTRTNDTAAQMRHGNRLGYLAQDDLFTPPAAAIYESIKTGSRSELRRGLLEELYSSFNLAGSATDAEAAIASYVWEILRNTQVHGQISGGPPMQGIRITELKRYSLDQFRENSVLAGATDHQLTSYLTKVRAASGKASIVEITVADSGPGIAATMLGSAEAPSRDGIEELEATRFAFTRRGTSLSRSDPDAGLGLILALRACRELDSFVSIRTGRVQLTKHYLTSDQANDQLWVREDRSLPLLAGTSVTILIPWLEVGASLTPGSRR